MSETNTNQQERATSPVDNNRQQGETSAAGISENLGIDGQQESPGHMRASVVQNPSQNYSQRCDVCDRTFETKIGLGVHFRKAHPLEANERVNVRRVKARWTPEEVRLLAREEAKAIQAGQKLPMNIYLHKLFPDRTIDSIKKRRQSEQYRALVSRYVSGRSTRSSVGTRTLPRGRDSNVTQPIDSHDRSRIEQSLNHLVEEIRELASSNRAAQELILIVQGALRGDVVEEKILGWIKSLVPEGSRPKGPALTSMNRVTGVTNRMRRKQEFAIVQGLFKKGLSAVGRHVLDTSEEQQIAPSSQELFAYWHEVFSKESSPLPEAARVRTELLKDLWEPIQEEEIMQTAQISDSSPGLDGVSSRNWKRVNAKFKAILYNLFLLRKKLPSDLYDTRTIFIPKVKGGSSNPGDYRPISIGSVIIRQFHKILGKRLAGKFDLSKTRQAGFLPVDGCGQNLMVLKTLLTRARQEKKELHLATVDISKAFDSVSHEAIVGRLKEEGCSVDALEYINHLYSNNKTILQVGSQEFTSCFGRGVKQGDPLSPLLFNLVMEKALLKLGNDVGFECDGHRISALAYADDIILISSTSVGLQRQLDVFVETTKPMGLGLNLGKCGVLSLVPSGKDKKVKILTEGHISVEGSFLRQIGPVDVWKYLGVELEGPNVKSGVSLGKDLIAVDRAPLKPQQRMLILRHLVMTRHLHALVLGRTTAAYLSHLDRNVRAFIRKWLHLPKDVPIGYYHSPIRNGGLGIPALLFDVPTLRLSRASRMMTSPCQFVKKIAARVYQDEQRKLPKRLSNVLFTNISEQEVGAQPQVALVSDSSESTEVATLVVDQNRSHVPVSNTTVDVSPAIQGGGQRLRKVRTHWCEKLYTSNDGRELSLAKTSPINTQWAIARAGIRGEDFVHFHQIRINALPSRVRTNRGRHGDIGCRAGCSSTETSYHTVQQCFRTHGGRVLRHNRVVDMLCAELERLGYKVFREVSFQTSAGKRIPDIIASKNSRGILLDVQVVSGNYLDLADRTKMAKYRDIPLFRDQLGAFLDCYTVDFGTATISWRGIWHKGSLNSLLQIGVSKKAVTNIVTSVLRGSFLCWRRFNQMTSVSPAYESY